VLTTLWKVESEAVYEITRYFYESMTGGVPLDEALRRAQVQWLNNADKSGELPYTWAGNVLIGNARPITTGWSLWHVWGATALTLAFFSIRFLLKKSANRPAEPA